jgi:hypothetical protein
MVGSILPMHAHIPQLNHVCVLRHCTGAHCTEGPPLVWLMAPVIRTYNRREIGGQAHSCLQVGLPHAEHSVGSSRIIQGVDGRVEQGVTPGVEGGVALCMGGRCVVCVAAVHM